MDAKEAEAKRNELLKTIEESKYYIVEETLTAKALMNCGDNPLLLAIEVS